MQDEVVTHMYASLSSIRMLDWEEIHLASSSLPRPRSSLPRPGVTRRAAHRQLMLWIIEMRVKQ